MSAKPLAGIKILSIEQLMALPFSTQILSDFGADIIAVESIGYGSYESSQWRERTGRDKRRIQVKLNDPKGQQLLRDMAASVDVVAENFRPGVMDRYGLGYRDMQKVSERLIYVSVSGYGHPDFLKSPLWDQAAYGPIGEAMSGAMHAIHGQGGRASGMALGDIVSSLFTTIGILIALRHRDETGEGQYLDVAMSDSLFALAELPFLNYSFSRLAESAGRAPTGRKSLVDYPSGVYAANDGEVQIIIMNDKHWDDLCRLLGHEEWIEDPEFNESGTRPRMISEVAVPLFSEWVQGQSMNEAAERLRSVGLAAAPVNGPADIADHEHFKARKMIETVERAGREAYQMAGNPIKLSAVEARHGPDHHPRLFGTGTHTREVLRELLEMNDEDFELLEKEGVVLDTEAGPRVERYAAVNDQFRNRAAIVGVGYSKLSKNSGTSVLTLAVDAISAAIADAGLDRTAIDGLATYAVMNDSASPSLVSQAMGFNQGLRYYVNQSGGGSLSHTVVGEAAMATVLGMADYVVCYRALNGRSGFRMGASGRAPAAGDEQQYLVPHGYTAPVHRYTMAARAHMITYGTTEAQLGRVAVNQRDNAALNERAIMRTPITIDDYFDARWIAEPLRLLDCCLETDGACAVVVTSAERARDLRRPAVHVANAVWGPGHHVTSGTSPNLTEGGCKYTASRLFEGAGLTPADVDVAEIYDCFSYTVLLQLEDYGFCPKGEGGPFVASGVTSLGGSLPVNTHGGFLSEGYVHGLNTLCEAVSQLRGDAGERQVTGAEVALSTGADGMIAGHTCAVLLTK